MQSFPYNVLLNLCPAVLAILDFRKEEILYSRHTECMMFE